MPIALKTLIKIAGEDRELLNDILSSFYCEKDSDIEFFLHERAVENVRMLISLLVIMRKIVLLRLRASKIIKEK